MAHVRNDGLTKRRGRKTLSGILGHFSSGFTLYSCGHVTTGMKQDAASLEAAMEEAALYHSVIRDGYADVASTLASAIAKANTARFDSLATQATIDAAETALRKALGKAEANKLAADLTAFDAYKTEKKNAMDALSETQLPFRSTQIQLFYQQKKPGAANHFRFAARAGFLL